MGRKPPWSVLFTASVIPYPDVPFSPHIQGVTSQKLDHSCGYQSGRQEGARSRAGIGTEGDALAWLLGLTVLTFLNSVHR